MRRGRVSIPLLKKSRTPSSQAQRPPAGQFLPCQGSSRQRPSLFRVSVSRLIHVGKLLPDLTGADLHPLDVPIARRSGDGGFPVGGHGGREQGWLWERVWASGVKPDWPFFVGDNYRETRILECGAMWLWSRGTMEGAQGSGPVGAQQQRAESLYVTLCMMRKVGSHTPRYFNYPH